MKNEELYHYILGIADNSLILGQRLGELCGHGPSLETDIALTNISLDLFGQTRSYFQYAAKIKGEDATEDSIAFLRTERQYRNVLLVEQPNTDFAYTIARQFLFDIFHYLFLEQLKSSKDVNLSAIAHKAFKEVSYHQRFSSDWMKRFGDGTVESAERIQNAINDLWRYTEELFYTSKTDELLIASGIGVQVSDLKEPYYKRVCEILEQAKLVVPESKWFQKGGKDGVHTEHMGFILSDMQYMQRTFPNMTW